MLLLAAIWGHAQTDLDTIQVSASRQSTPLRLALKSLHLVSHQDLQHSASQTIGEALEQVTSLDLRHRGPLDIQVDPGIRGGTFDQTLILINGMKMTDPQTGHHQMNLPVALGSLSHVEVLETGGSRIYGPNAFAGAIHLHTATSGPNRIKGSLSGGSYGLARASLMGQLNTGSWFSLLALDAAKSDGYRTNTDFQSGNAWLQTGYHKGNHQLLFQGGMNTKGFGAQDFYSSRYPTQYEATRTAFASIRFQGGEHWKYFVQANARQHHDRFELFREEDRYYTYADGVFVTENKDTAVFVPGVQADWNYYRGHNYHRTRVFGGEVGLAHSWGRSGTTAIGLEWRQEEILSNALGTALPEPIAVAGEDRGQYLRGDERTNLSGFVEHGVHRGPWHLNGGMLINQNTAFGLDFLPGLDVGYAFLPGWMGYASIDRSFRFPTFTDLYYNLGGARGSTDLQPEYSLNLEMGVRGIRGQHQSVVSVFRRDGRELIDWVQWSPDSLQAENLTRVIMQGISAQWTWMPSIAWLDKVRVGYTGLWAQSDDLGVPSLYVLDQLRHKLIVSARHYWGRIGFQWQFNLQDRAGSYIDFPTGESRNYETVLLLDARLDYKREWWSVFLTASNLLDHEYVDRGYVIQPGMWITGGVEVDLVRQ